MGFRLPISLAVGGRCGFGGGGGFGGGAMEAQSVSSTGGGGAMEAQSVSSTGGGGAMEAQGVLSTGGGGAMEAQSVSSTGVDERLGEALRVRGGGERDAAATMAVNSSDVVIDIGTRAFGA